MSNKHSVLIANAKIKSTASLKKYICTDTKQTILTNVRAGAVSPFSGSSYLSPMSIASVAHLDKVDLSKYKQIAKCGGCGTTWSANKAFASAHDTFNCVVCAEDLEVRESLDLGLEDLFEGGEEEFDAESFESDILEGIDDLDGIKIEDDELEDAEEDMYSDVSSDEYFGEDLSVESSRSLAKKEKEEEEEEEEKKEKEEEDSLEDLFKQFDSNEDESIDYKEFEEGFGDMEPSQIEDIFGDEDLTEEDMDLPEGLEEEDSEEGEKKGKKVESFNLAAALNKEGAREKIEFVASTIDSENPTYYIMVNRVPVAQAEFAKASENVKSIFSNTELYSKALLATLDLYKTDKKQSVKDFGVSPIKAPIVSSRVAIKAGIAKGTKAIKAAYAKKEEDMLANFRQSFSIAAMQACKGLKKDENNNPQSLLTKAALSEALRMQGIQGHEGVIEEAFQRGIIKDFNTIVTEAWSLFSRTPEFREEMAAFAGKATYQETLAPSNQASTTDSFESTASVRKGSGTYLGSDLTTVPDFDVFAKIRANVKTGNYSR